MRLTYKVVRVADIPDPDMPLPANEPEHEAYHGDVNIRRVNQVVLDIFHELGPHIATDDVRRLLARKSLGPKEALIALDFYVRPIAYRGRQFANGRHRAQALKRAEVTETLVEDY